MLTELQDAVNALVRQAEASEKIAGKLDEVDSILDNLYANAATLERIAAALETMLDEVGRLVKNSEWRDAHVRS